ncbi:HEPN domain-containing protein [Enterovirga aerilata]|uniref:HEPN domain-containing protein n=1 Tax=Enterovirga aerilata TaxID=2730920 RepID=A0A849IJU7_9HYPH|nr:HEPN domain-containing protein [Enterovirga sp. DB1703]NNM74213.1 HEPN domain-containing protein [Enterovirga sp. DB1703]
MPSGSAPASLHVANSLRLADRDLKDAELLLREGSRNASYHLEQAAEKLLLALLTSEDIHVAVAETHRLDILADRLPEEHPLRDPMRKLAFLQAYATAFRYVKTAGRLPPPMPADKFSLASEALRKLIDGAARHFEVDLEAKDNVPAGKVERMRTTRTELAPVRAGDGDTRPRR